MLARKPKKTMKTNFHIKLLSGNNVVLVEAEGYDSEIFMPEIVNGRVSFQNIIPNRRCCCADNLNSLKLMRKSQLPMPSCFMSQEHSCYGKNALSNSTNNKAWCMTNGQDLQLDMRLPNIHITRITPTSPFKSNLRVPFVKSLRMKSNAYCNKENLPKITQKSIENRHHDTKKSLVRTPEAARSGSEKTADALNNTMVQISPGIKIIRLYRNPTPKTPVKKANTAVVTADPPVGTESPPVENKDEEDEKLKEITTTVATAHSTETSFNLPQTPDISTSKTSKRVTNKKKSVSTVHSKIRKSTPAKWRHKCITPKRTYSRKMNITGVQKNISPSIAQKGTKTFRTVLPTYMANPTQGIKAVQKMKLQRRKLILDPKKALTPEPLKKQVRKKSVTVITPTPKKNRLIHPAGNRKDFERSKQTAFDLLTNSNRCEKISKRLNNQFRNGCVNRASTTHTDGKTLLKKHDNCYSRPESPSQKTQLRQRDQSSAAAMAERAATQAMFKSVRRSAGFLS